MEFNLYLWGFNLFDDFVVVDYGDCWFDVYNLLLIKLVIVEYVCVILCLGVKMLMFGGDYYIMYLLLVVYVECYG